MFAGCLSAGVTDTGTTYKATIQPESPNAISARAYLAIPLFGETRTLGGVQIGINAMVLSSAV